MTRIAANNGGAPSNFHSHSRRRPRSDLRAFVFAELFMSPRLTHRSLVHESRNKHLRKYPAARLSAQANPSSGSLVVSCSQAAAAHIKKLQIRCSCAESTVAHVPTHWQRFFTYKRHYSIFWATYSERSDNRRKMY